MQINLVLLGCRQYISLGTLSSTGDSLFSAKIVSISLVQGQWLLNLQSGRQLDLTKSPSSFSLLKDHNCFTKLHCKIVKMSLCTEILTLKNKSNTLHIIVNQCQTTVNSQMDNTANILKIPCNKITLLTVNYILQQKIKQRK